MFGKIINKINIFNRCKKYGVLSVWQCPEFLFFIFGLVIIVAIVITNILAEKYAGPELAALLSMAITVLLLIIAYSIIKSFEYLAMTSEMKSEFIRIMSHELRTPLISIKWRLESYLSNKRDETLVQNNNNLDEEKDALIKIIQDQNEEMLKIINKFIILKKIEEGNFVLERTFFSLIDLIREIVSAKNKTFYNLIVVHEKTSELVITADREKIKIVLENLIDNALKYGKTEKEIRVILEKEGETAKVSINDRGAGIKRDIIKNLFKKFERPEKEINYQIPGLGIGLYLSKKIIEKHNGAINFKTKEGEGSTFWFTLPLKK